MDELSALVAAGLTQSEAKLYLVLCKGGRLNATALSKKSGVHRVSIYDTMRQLEAKGLAGRIEIKGTTEFISSPPAALLSMVDEKKNAIEAVMPNLSKSFEASAASSASVSYGKSGLKTVLQDILALRADYSVYYGQLQILDILPKFFQIFNDKRKKLGIKGRYILLDLPGVRERAKKIPLSEFRYIDPSTLSGGVWWVYSGRVVLLILNEEPIVFFIKSPELSKTFQKSFDDLFSKLKKAK